MMNLTVSDVLESAGAGPWFSYPELAELVTTADAVAHTIAGTSRRVRFCGEAAEFLEGTPPSIAAGVDVRWQLEALEDQRPTPCGAVEVWGSICQLVDAYADQVRRT